jgi:hypothetical protein
LAADFPLWVHLHVPLGQALGPLPHRVQPHYQPKGRNKNTPSRQRCRARRAAAREQAMVETELDIVELSVEETNSVDDKAVTVAEEAPLEPFDETTTEAVAVEVTAADDDALNEVNNFECYFCDLDCVSEENLENHWHEKHSDALYSSESEQSEKESDEYNCEKCNSKFQNAGQLRRHRKKNHR